MGASPRPRSVAGIWTLSWSSPVIVFMPRHYRLRVMAGPLLVADAPHLLYRAFYALPDSITGPDDQPVNALLGSVNVTLQVIEEHHPRAIVMCTSRGLSRNSTTAA